MSENHLFVFPMESEGTGESTDQTFFNLFLSQPMIIIRTVGGKEVEAGGKEEEEGGGEKQSQH